MAGRRSTDWSGVENAGNIIAGGIQDQTKRRQDFEDKVNAAMMNRAIEGGRFDQQLGVQGPPQSADNQGGSYMKDYKGYTYRQPKTEPRTPQQEAERAAAIQNAKLDIVAGREKEVLQNHLRVIKNTLNDIPPPEQAWMATAQGIGRRALGPFGGRFRDAQTSIEATVGPFLQGVEKISRGRMSKSQMDTMANMIRDLPLLNEADRQHRFSLIDQMLRDSGVDLSGNASSQPNSGSHDDFISQMESRGYKYRGAK